MSLDQFIRPKEIAAALRVNYQAFLRKLRDGDGPRFKRYGTRILIRRDWYEAWLDADDRKRRK